jgi:site-specific DNA-methyltransferase (adenine-specific)
MKIGRHRLHVEDCLLGLRRLEAESVEAIVTDPPYGLGAPPDAATMLRAWLDGDVFDPGGSGFMGKEWDSFVPPPAIFRELLRVAKPGAHAIVFAGSRTFDLMALSMRLAGWEIRDGLSYLYGSGFPKSTDVSKMIDRAEGAERKCVGIYQRFGRAGRKRYGIADGHVYGAPSSQESGVMVTAPATPDAVRFEGWGSALKPAWEPIILARKPLAGTLAENALAHGCGGLNIDATRIPTEEPLGRAKAGWQKGGYVGGKYPGWDSRGVTKEGGRWPANVLLSHSEECSEDCAPGCPVALLDEQSGDRPVSGAARNGRPSNAPDRGWIGAAGLHGTGTLHDDSGGASRFFYCAKPSRAEREAGLDDLPERVNGRRNVHPTVKPLDLLRHLIRLVCPEGGTVLDPFSGSGSTLIAAEREGFASIGFEREPEYAEIASHRLAHWIRVSARERLAARSSRPRPPSRRRK